MDLTDLLADLDSFTAYQREGDEAFRIAMGGISATLAGWVSANPGQVLAYDTAGFEVLRAAGQAALDAAGQDWVVEVDAGEARHRLAGLPRVTVRRKGG